MSPMDAYLSQQVYSDLVLTKKWKHVDYQFINRLQTCIFMTKEPGTEVSMVELNASLYLYP